MKAKRFLLVVLFLIFVFPSPLFAATVLPTYEPYQDDEFPSWLKKVRRLEVITLGATALSYPIVGIFAKEGPFDDSTMKGFWAKFGLSAGVGFLIAITDLIIGEVQEKKARDKARAIENGEYTEPVITLDPNSKEARKLDELKENYINSTEESVRSSELVK